MQFTIIYFSGTGNTQLVSQQISSRLTNIGHQVELVSIEDIDELEKINFDGEILGFGFPVYKFTYPDNFKKTLSIINNLVKNYKYFLFSTYTRFASNALSDFASQLNNNNFTLIAQDSFKCPSCGISARLPIDDYEYKSVMFFEDSIDKRIDNFVDSILKNQNSIINIKQIIRPLSSIKKSIVANIEITKYPKLKIDTTKCTVCGLCARKCPDSNLNKLSSHIDIADDKGCLHCLRCINHCPQNAITFGKLTEGDNQYTIKVRDELYKKSIEGHKEQYWSNFEKIIAKWRRKTIRYWVTHFHINK